MEAADADLLAEAARLAGGRLHLGVGAAQRAGLDQLEPLGAPRRPRPCAKVIGGEVNHAARRAAMDALGRRALHCASRICPLPPSQLARKSRYLISVGTGCRTLSLSGAVRGWRAELALLLGMARSFRPLRASWASRLGAEGLQLRGARARRCASCGQPCHFIACAGC